MEAVMDYLHANGEAVIAAATIVLVVVTAFLAVYTGLLWRATKRLAEDAQRNSTRQAEEMKESLRIAALQAETASKSFIATHRPRLVVRQVGHIEYVGLPASEIAIRYAVHNVGDSQARIIGISENVWLPTSTENLPSVPPYKPITPKNVVLNSGDWLAFEYKPPLDVQEQLGFQLGFLGQVAPSAKEVSSNAEPILFLGNVVYMNEAGNLRTTAFLRRYNAATGRFDPINHPDYEYQD
jgi:hypothetical protein